MKHNIVPLCLVITFTSLLVSMMFISMAQARTCPDYTCKTGTNCGTECCRHFCNNQYLCYKYDVVQNNTDDGTSCSDGADCKVGDTCRNLECNRYNATGNSVCRSAPAFRTDIAGCPATSEYIQFTARRKCYYWCPIEIKGTVDAGDSPCMRSPVNSNCKYGKRESAIFECYDWSGISCLNITENGDTCTEDSDCSPNDCLATLPPIAFGCVGGVCKFGVPNKDTVICVSMANAATECVSRSHVGTTNVVKQYCWNCCKNPCDGVTCHDKCIGNIRYYNGVCVEPAGICNYDTTNCNTQDGCSGSTYLDYYCQIASAACKFNSFPCDSRCDNHNPTATITGAPATWQNTDATGTVICTDPDGCCDATKNAYEIFYTDPGSCNTATFPLTALPFTIDRHAWVCAYVKDRVGKIGKSAPQEFKVDKIKPDITCTNCYHPSPAISGTDVIFSPLVNDIYSGVQRVRICADADCTKIYCQNNIYAPAGTPVVRECSYPTEDCIYSENEFYIEATDMAGNTETINGGTFTTILRDDCKCEDSHDCKTGKCIAGQCLVIINPDILFTSTGATAELGSKTHLVISIKNNLAVSDTIKIRLYGTPEKMLYWTKFKNNNQEIDITLDAYEEKRIPIEIFAGKTGTYKLTTSGISTLVQTLYAKDVQTIHIVNKDQDITSRTPGLNAVSILLLILLTATIISAKKNN